MPTIMRPPPAMASMVIACMPSIAGGRPASCTTAVPSLMRSVARRDRRERGERVGAVGLGRPHRVEAELLGALHEVVRHLHRRGAVQLQSESQFQHAGDATRRKVRPLGRSVDRDENAVFGYDGGARPGTPRGPEPADGRSARWTARSGPTPATRTSTEPRRPVREEPPRRSRRAHAPQREGRGRQPRDDPRRRPDLPPAHAAHQHRLPAEELEELRKKPKDAEAVGFVEVFTRAPGANDPQLRLVDLDEEGIWGEVIYPSLGDVGVLDP